MLSPHFKNKSAGPLLKVFTTNLRNVEKQSHPTWYPPICLHLQRPLSGTSWASYYELSVPDGGSGFLLDLLLSYNILGPHLFIYFY